MHNIAIALHCNHHTVTGSDDEIYDPSRSRLAKYDLLPKKMGWDEEQITTEIELVVLGMHARKDNPELIRAKALNIPVLSFPEFIYQHAKNKKRIVVAGSHGKTSTTSMIMHVLNTLEVDFDYLVGAQLDGFETMVRLSDAPIMVIEGDEYLSSPIDRRPKIVHYRPHISILTGIAWDHINVFPTFENYVSQFETYIHNLDKESLLIYYEQDEEIQQIIQADKLVCQTKSYMGFVHRIEEDETIVQLDGANYPVQIFGAHNMQNLQAAYFVCQELGISKADFFKQIQGFRGAAKRLELLYQDEETVIFQDFAHAPSKVRATTDAIRARFSDTKVFACLELHTFSSLNKAFLPHYQHSLQAADQAVVYFSQHTLRIKRLDPISKDFIQQHFDHPNLIVLSDEDDFRFELEQHFQKGILVLMSSGTFGGIEIKKWIEDWMEK